MIFVFVVEKVSWTDVVSEAKLIRYEVRRVASCSICEEQFLLISETKLGAERTERTCYQASTLTVEERETVRGVC